MYNLHICTTYILYNLHIYNLHICTTYTHIQTTHIYTNLHIYIYNLNICTTYIYIYIQPTYIYNLHIYTTYIYIQPTYIYTTYIYIQPTYMYNLHIYKLHIYTTYVYVQPTYLSELLVPYIPSCNLRSSDQHLLVVPNIKSTLGKRAFSFSAPSIWNSLPLSLRMCTSISTFRSQLKTHFFPP